MSDPSLKDIPTLTQLAYLVGIGIAGFFAWMFGKRGDAVPSAPTHPFNEGELREDLEKIIASLNLSLDQRLNQMEASRRSEHNELREIVNDLKVESARLDERIKTLFSRRER